MRLREAIDNIFSHNERVAIWATDLQEPHYSRLIWKGMGHQIPEKFMDYRCNRDWRIFGTVPESIIDGDVINIKLNRPCPRLNF